MTSLLLQQNIQDASAAAPVKAVAGYDPDWDVNLHSYDLIVLQCLNKGGIQKVTDILKKLAELQSTEDSIHANLLEINQLLQDLQNAGLANPDAKPGDADYGKIKDDFFKGDTGKAWLAKFKAAWDKIFNTPNDNGLSAMEKWKLELEAQGIKPDEYPAYTNLKDLQKSFGEDKFGVDTDPTTKAKSMSISDWLDKPSVPAGEDDPDAASVIKTFSHAFQETYKYNHSTTGTKTGTDFIGNASSSNSTSTQLISGLSNSNSTEISMQTQQLTSYVNIGQQIIQSASSGKEVMVNNETKA